MHLAFRLAAGAVGAEFLRADPVEDGFRHHRARRIPGAEKEDVVAAGLAAHAGAPVDGQQPAPPSARDRLHTPVSGRTSSTRSAAARSPAMSATIDRTCS